MNTEITSKRHILFVVLTLICFGTNLAQDIEIREEPRSFNDQGVEYAEQGEYWKAVQAFERAMRTSGVQKRTARANVVQFRKEVDLPAHTILHFGWVNGIGQLANFLPKNAYYICSVLSLLAIIVLFFMPRLWTWKSIGILLALALTLYALGRCCAVYQDADGLVILTSDADLKDKPYEVSGEKQIVFEGQMGLIEQTYEDYYLIQTDTYEKGWVLKTQTETIW